MSVSFSQSSISLDVSNIAIGLTLYWPAYFRAEPCVGSITDDQFAEFTKNGAIGSHLENLQRKGGFKGFNQHTVSLIIVETDPRKQESSHFQTVFATGSK